jgi:CRISPR-associated endonuclease Csn1
MEVRKILGIDLGVTSIGWAFVEKNIEDADASKILRAGSVIVPLTTDEADLFTKGLAQTKNQNRAKKASTRRQRRRYQQRRKKLIVKLVELELFPMDNREQERLVRSSEGDTQEKLFRLRAEALQRALTPFEIGRVFLHLNQRRGFKSNRKIRIEAETEKEEERTKFYQEIDAWKSRTETPGQFYAKMLSNNLNYRVKDQRVPRERYQDEFNRIWNFQQQFHSVLTEENKRAIGNHIIYFQRKLSSKKGLVSQCQFEKDYRVCPISSPYHQERKVWEDINKIRIYKKRAKVSKNDKGEPVEVTLPMRQTIYDALQQRFELSKEEILALFPALATLKKYSVNLPEIQSDDGKTKEQRKLHGNNTRQNFFEALTETGVQEIEKYLRFDLTNFQKGNNSKKLIIWSHDGEHEPLYQLWHLLYSITESDEIPALRKKLKGRYGFSDETIDKLLQVDLWHEFSSLSAKATKNLLPYLRQGLIYSDACEAFRQERIQGLIENGIEEEIAPLLAGYRHSAYLTKDEAIQKELVNHLNLIPRNKLRNPVAEKILNHLIQLMNAILADEELGRPDEIHVEYARELRKSIKARKRATDEKDKNEKDRNRIRKLLKPYIPAPTNSDIERYKIWEECGCVSPYEPYKLIDLTELFDGSRYEVDHILPQSRYFDDSPNNKVISRCSVNAEKSNRTAEDYMHGKSLAEYESFVKFVENTKTLSDRKKKLLRMSAAEIPTDHIERQLRETAYICRTAGTLLRDVVGDHNVIATSGSITAFLRRRWGLESVLKYLNKDRYERLGRVHYDKDQNGRSILIIDDWTKRDDHRHHALDAIAIACTSRSMIKRLNDLNHEFDSYAALNESGLNIPRPWPALRIASEKALASVLVSFRVGKRLTSLKKDRKNPNDKGQLIPRGELHKETIYGRRVVNGKTIFTQRVPIDGDFKADWVKDIIDPNVRGAMSNRLSGSTPKESFKDLEKNPIWLNEKKGVAIKRVRVKERPTDPLPLRSKIPGGRKDKDFVQTSNNHHVTIYEDDNGIRREAEVVTLIDAVRRKQNGLPVINRNLRSDWKFLFSMRINELFIFDLDPTEIDFFNTANYPILNQYLYRAESLSPKDYWFRHHTASTQTDDSQARRYRSASKLNATKVRVSKTGRIISIGETT